MRLNKLSVILLVTALCSGGAATWSASSYIRNTVDDYRAELDREYEKIRIVVAATDIPEGVPVSSRNLSAREVPRAFLHKDAISPEQWKAFDGRLSRAFLTGGAPILKSQLLDPAAAGFAGSLEPGKRALTVPVDQVSSISGLLAPGDRVDILFSHTRERRRQTVVLMTDIPVLATGIDTGNQHDNATKSPVNGFTTVTLLVEPDQAARLVHAREEGTLSVVLRSEDGKPAAWPDKITLSSLLGEVEPVAPRPPIAAKPTVQVILGGTPTSQP